MRPHASSSPLPAQIRRFLVLGAANTALTTAAFHGLSLILPASVAFSVVYACALIYLTAMTPRFVFRARLGSARAAALAGWYVFVYLVGLAVIRALEHGVGVDQWAVTLGTVAVTSPLSFIGARVLAGQAASADSVG